MVTLPERGHIQKPKIEIVILKSEKFDSVQAQRNKLVCDLFFVIYIFYLQC